MPPGNDNFVDSLKISGNSISVNATNVDATGEAGEPDHASFQFGGNSGNPDNFNSVWWNWTASANGVVTIDTIGSGYDTTLGVYTGSAVNGLTEIASNDDGIGIFPQSQVIFNAVAGQTYQIAVDGWSSAQGEIALNLDFEVIERPVNDNFDDSIRLVGPSVSTTGTNEFSTGEAGEPDHASFQFGGNFGNPNN
ncbi:MAG: hypothetical protein F6K10_17025, partial [Moorea sp. SIO2B7]|nr:hypothetical protein [Moorena sp. SIO2B7]